MIPLVLLGFFLIFADIFFGIPILCVMLMFKADLWIVAVVGIVMVLAPFICFVVELNRRNQYDVRVDVSYRVGESATSEKNMTIEDRIGYVTIMDEQGKKTTGKEWRLLNIGLPVVGFEPKYIEQRKVWWGYWTVKHAHIIAVQGERGVEFQPMGYDASAKGYKPAFTGDRGLLYYKLVKDIENRNKFENAWKEYLPYIILGGLIVIVAVFQFLTWLKMGDFINALDGVAGKFQACADQNQAAISTIQNKTGTGVKAGTIGGVIPFGATAG